MVRQSGVSNAEGLGIPLQTKLNIKFIEEMTKGSLHAQIIKYLKYGWPLGHKGFPIPEEPRRNHKGVRDFHDQTWQYLLQEKQKDRVFGPCEQKVFHGKNGISPLNSVPRKEGNKRRFILDLSFPKGSSINDGIDKDWYQGEPVDLKYPTVDDLVQLIYSRKESQPGKPVLLWKRDLKSCYRQFQLCPGSVHLVGYKFDNSYWYDRVLAMGSSSSAQICQKVTDMVRFVFEQRFDDQVRNFLDDFFSANSDSEVWESYENLGKLLDTMGIEENPEKACPPAACMIVLGILFDTIAMTLRLPDEKMAELILELKKWDQKETCTVKQMQSLVGKLNFAAGVVRSGRIYMARLINTLRNRLSNSTGTIKLSQENLNDVRWWLEHVKIYNGVPMESLMVSKHWESPGSIWSSDSSGSGLGGWAQQTRHFFHFDLDKEWQQRDINSLECMALLLCVKKWSEQCRGKKVLVQCDNQTTVTIINSCSARDRFLQACLREIQHICALNSAEIRAVWLKTSQNEIADALSRWNQHPKYAECFRQLTQGAEVFETKILPHDLKFVYTVI